VTVPQSIGSATTPFDRPFTTAFVATGSITITKTTNGGTGTTEFSIVPTVSTGESETANPVYQAVSTTAGVPVTAIQILGDHSLNALDMGTYSIVESGPVGSAGGTWAPQPVTCNGVASDPTASDVLVTPSPSDPHVSCAFTNAFTATPAPPTPPTTSPGGVAANDLGTSGSALASTGANLPALLGVGTALVLAGGALLAVDRQRRRPEPVPVSSQDVDPST